MYSHFENYGVRITNYELEIQNTPVYFICTMRKLLNEELPRLSKEEFKQHVKTPLVIVLDNVRSHLNVGSIFRTADAFLIVPLAVRHPGPRRSGQ